MVAPTPTQIESIELEDDLSKIIPLVANTAADILSLQQMGDSMPQIVWTANADGWIDYYNQQWVDYTGMSIKQTQGWGWSTILHPDDLQNCIVLWTNAIKNGTPYVCEYRFKRAYDGSYRWHLGRARPIRDPSGEIIKWFGTCTDIHDHRQTNTPPPRTPHNSQFQEISSAPGVMAGAIGAIKINEIAQSSSSYDTRMAIVEKELGSAFNILSRFEAAIEKIGDVSNSLKEMLAVHTVRINDREKADLTIFGLIEKRKEEYSKGIDRVQQKIDDLGIDIRKQVHEEINDQYIELRESLSNVIDTQKTIADKIDTRINIEVKNRDTKLDLLEGRIRTLENWRWLILGLGIAVGFVVKSIPAFIQAIH